MALERRMAALDGEIAALVREIEQRSAAGDDVRGLRLRLDAAKRQRGLLDFYVPNDPSANAAGAAEQQTSGGRSCLALGCLGVCSLGVVGGGLAYLVTLSPNSDDEVSSESVEVVAEPTPVVPQPPAAPMPAPAPERFVQPVLRTGQVMAATGATSVARGDPCTVAVTPESTNFNCRIVVRCADQVLYGSDNAGYNRCAVKDGQPMGAKDRSDTDGDPICSLDLTAGSVILSSNQPPATFAIAIRLNEAAAVPDAGANAPVTAGDGGLVAPRQPPVGAGQGARSAATHAPVAPPRPPPPSVPAPPKPPSTPPPSLESWN
jgi:hypothetical protein